MKNLFVSITLAITAIFSASAAQATVIDFNGLSGASYPGGYAAYGGLYTYFEGSVSLEGITFIPDQSEPYQWFAGDLNARIFCRGMYGRCASNGTDYLLTSSSLSFRRTDGGAFNLNAFDMGNYFDSDDDSSPAQSSFVVEARRSNGDIVIQPIMLDKVPNYFSGPNEDFNHFTFVGFSDVRSVHIRSLTAREWSGTVLDNLDVTAVGPGEVPEPASLALVGLGLAGLLRSRRRFA